MPLCDLKYLYFLQEWLWLQVGKPVPMKMLETLFLAVIVDENLNIFF